MQACEFLTEEGSRKTRASSKVLRGMSLGYDAGRPVELGQSRKRGGHHSKEKLDQVVLCALDRSLPAKPICSATVWSTQTY